MDPSTCRALGFRTDGIYDLSLLGLRPDAIERRRSFIGGSDATIIASGDAEKINTLARFKRGLEPAVDLSDLIHVMLGNVTEPFILAWAERQLGISMSRRGEEAVHARFDFLRCTLDSWTTFQGRQMSVQVKHVNAFSSEEQALAYYTPQLQHELMVTQADAALMLVMVGTLKFGWAVVEPDPVFQARLRNSEMAFWQAVREGRDPEVVVPQLTKAEKAAGRFEFVDMTTHAVGNEWGDAAARFLKHKEAAESFEKAKTDLKALVPATAKQATGSGVKVTVDKKNAMKVEAFPAQVAA
ncbi:hypothetical protein EOD42_14410 [Rhodovarius crocodyli]|uniref:YqaJ viral recombinase domain-containing protein n=1 Tax=Rhodovarius crocodyli TaxID=1979269 RepID=A0A437MF94_9PROT|nr:YqaJ viral recombinase family protein [Rhodovarius crocodyli]RVT96300.1 hypothetical protein EOD42_14410 [Rhodovarius crocodyli]